MEIAQEVKVVQEAALANNLVPGESAPVVVSTLDSIQKIFDDSTAKCLNSIFGRDKLAKIKKVMKIIDADHPDIETLFGGVFATESLVNNISERFELIKFINSSNMTTADTCISHAGREVARIFSKIKHPEENNRNIRLIKSPKERTKLRGQRKLQAVELESFYANGGVEWFNAPKTFHMFVRNNSLYEEEVERAKAQVEMYKAMGIPEVAGAVEASLQSAGSGHGEYYGFHNIQMTKAAVMLAQLHGYTIEYKEQSRKLSRRNVHVIFKNFTEDTTSVRWSEFRPDRMKLNYEAIAVPFEEMKSFACPDVVKMIDGLDKFEEIGGKAIFDEFVTIVPAYSLANYYHPYHFVGNTSKRYSENGAEFRKAVCEERASRDDVHPIVLGIKDGKCFFVSYLKSVE